MEMVTINLENINEYVLGCLSNKKHLGFKLQPDCLMSRFEEGWKLKHLIYNGKLLAEHYKSNTAFRNIIKKLNA